MLESFPVAVLVATALGFLAGLGVGGGSLLILWLTVVLGLEQETARAVNLLFFVPSAVIACLFRWRQGYLKWQVILPAALAGCIAAAVFSALAASLDLTLMKRLFGGLLIVTGLRELFYRPRKLR